MNININTVNSEDYRWIKSGRNKKLVMDEIVVLARKEYLPDVLKFINNHLKSVNYNKKANSLFELSVEEAYVNIVNYAYKTDDGKVVIRCKVDENPLKITAQFIDWGIPFNPLKKEDPDISQDIEKKVLGGLGIFLIKKYVDHMEYEYQDGKNILTIQKILI